MRVVVRAKPRSKAEYVKELEGGVLEVAVKEVPEEGRANARIVELIAEYFGVSKSSVRQLSGHKGRVKVFQIMK
jgi:hypothetical protein